jgi:hypothetical protein
LGNQGKHKRQNKLYKLDKERFFGCKRQSNIILEWKQVAIRSGVDSIKNYLWNIYFSAIDTFIRNIRRFYYINGRLFEKFSLRKEKKLKNGKVIIIERHLIIKTKKNTTYGKTESQKRKVKKHFSKYYQKTSHQTICFT